MDRERSIDEGRRDWKKEENGRWRDQNNGEIGSGGNKGRWRDWKKKIKREGEIRRMEKDGEIERKEKGRWRDQTKEERLEEEGVKDIEIGRMRRKEDEEIKERENER